MAYVTPASWDRIKQQAQDTILEAADRNWGKARELSDEVRVTRLTRVRFGGIAWLAYKMSTDAMRQAGPKADQIPTRDQIILGRLLVGINRFQRVKLYMDVFKDSLIKTRKDGSVPSGAPLSSHVAPRERRRGASEQSDYINVLTTGRLGEAAIVVSLRHPANDERPLEPVGARHGASSYDRVMGEAA